ncbi:MAG TPA: TIGR03663 family protein [Methanosarcinales archaeon]|nr:TIGR03663 family protein [Methanosarcinales archaeon]
MNQTKRYLLIFLAIVLLASALRFYTLDDRVFHHDEGVHGYLTYKLLKNGAYHYDPTYHGPFLYYTTAAAFKLFGDSNFTARMLPAVAGVLLVALIYALRDVLGRSGALATAAMIAVSPSFLYYSRFLRNDTYIALFSLIFVISAVKYVKLRRRSGWHNSGWNDDWYRLIYVGTGATAGALAVCTKENAYIIAGIFFLFALGYLVTKRAINRTTILDTSFFALIFLAIFTLFYSRFFTDFDALTSVVPDAISHWTEMHRIERIGGHWSFYLPILVRYELLITVFALIGGGYYIEKRNTFMIFLLYWGITSLLIYSYLQEKVPWLVLHILLPFVLIAGAYLGELVPTLSKRSKRVEAATIAVVILLAGLFIQQSIFINYCENTESDEITIPKIPYPVHGLIYVQTTSEVLDVVDFIDQRLAGDPNTSILIAAPDNDYWPLPWYTRNYAGCGYLNHVPERSDAEIVIVPDKDKYNITLGWEYSRKTFTLRPGYDMARYYRSD